MNRFQNRLQGVPLVVQLVSGLFGRLSELRQGIVLFLAQPHDVIGDLSDDFLHFIAAAQIIAFQLRKECLKTVLEAVQNRVDGAQTGNQHRPVHAGTMAECRVGFQCGNQLRFTGDRVKMISPRLEAVWKPRELRQAIFRLTAPLNSCSARW